MLENLKLQLQTPQVSTQQNLAYVGDLIGDTSGKDFQQTLDLSLKNTEVQSLDGENRSSEFEQGFDSQSYGFDDQPVEYDQTENQQAFEQSYEPDESSDYVPQEDSYRQVESSVSENQRVSEEASRVKAGQGAQDSQDSKQQATASQEEPQQSSGSDQTQTSAAKSTEDPVDRKTEQTSKNQEQQVDQNGSVDQKDPQVQITSSSDQKPQAKVLNPSDVQPVIENVQNLSQSLKKLFQGESLDASAKQALLKDVQAQLKQLNQSLDGLSKQELGDALKGLRQEIGTNIKQALGSLKQEGLQNPLPELSSLKQTLQKLDGVLKGLSQGTVTVDSLKQSGPKSSEFSLEKLLSEVLPEAQKSTQSSPERSARNALLESLTRQGQVIKAEPNANKGQEILGQLGLESSSKPKAQVDPKKAAALKAAKASAQRASAPEQTLQVQGLAKAEKPLQLAQAAPLSNAQSTQGQNAGLSSPGESLLKTLTQISSVGEGEAKAQSNLSDDSQSQTKLAMNESSAKLSNQKADQTLGKLRFAQSFEQAKEVPKALQQQVVSQVAKQAQTMGQLQKGEMQLRLDPPQLGHVKMTLKMQDGKLMAKIDVQNEVVRQALSSNSAISALKSNLEQQDIRVSKLEITVAEQSSTGDSSFSERSLDSQSKDSMAKSPRAHVILERMHNEETPEEPVSIDTHESEVSYLV